MCCVCGVCVESDKHALVVNKYIGVGIPSRQK